MDPDSGTHTKHHEAPRSRTSKISPDLSGEFRSRVVLSRVVIVVIVVIIIITIIIIILIILILRMIRIITIISILTPINPSSPHGQC